MKHAVRLAALAFALLSIHAVAQEPPAAGQEAPAMNAEQQAMMAAWTKAATPGPQHQQLVEHFSGTWTTKQTMWMDPSAPPMVETGQSVDTAVLGGRHVQTMFTGQVMGQPFEGRGLTGYDNVTGKYTSSWADNMSTGQMLMRGDYDAATKTYTFRGDMPDPMKNGAATPIRQVIRITDRDHHVFEMHETRDGKESRTMQIEYTRAAP